MILADFHIHSTFSDGRLSIPEIVDFYGSRGFGSIAVTDHVCEEASFLGKTARYLEKTLTKETFPKYLQTLYEEAERAWDQYTMVLIPGVELTRNSLSNHRSAHVLALGIQEFIPADLDVLDMARNIRAQGGLSVAAHPVSTQKWEPQTYHLWGRRRELESELDAWEVASGPYLFEKVRKSGLPMLASSDLHHPSQMQSWKTVLECEKKTESIFQAVRRQKLSFIYYRDKFFKKSLH